MFLDKHETPLCTSLVSRKKIAQGGEFPSGTTPIKRRGLYSSNCLNCLEWVAGQAKLLFATQVCDPIPIFVPLD